MPHNYTQFMIKLTMTVPHNVNVIQQNRKRPEQLAKVSTSGMHTLFMLAKVHIKLFKYVLSCIE